MVAEMLAGLVPGGVYAGLAVCIVLMYQMLGVVNLALGAMGGLAACTSLLCVQWFGLGAGPSALVAVLCGALIGVLLGLQGTINPFIAHAAYQEIKDKPLVEKVATMRDPAFRRPSCDVRRR